MFTNSANCQFLAGFRIDSQYHLVGNATNPHHDLEAWQHDEDDHAYDPKDPKYSLDPSGSKGWATEEMFKTNEILGVQSSYNGIDGYST